MKYREKEYIKKEAIFWAKLIGICVATAGTFMLIIEIWLYPEFIAHPGKKIIFTIILLMIDYYMTTIVFRLQSENDLMRTLYQKGFHYHWKLEVYDQMSDIRQEFLTDNPDKLNAFKILNHLDKQEEPGASND
ncbi:hypothetical protein LJC17_01455 [Acholeplasma sp. OttesenSCG-928-E16]|nr:hypothetical protein [Acholeplasma sp. OttesenSCG-928-E16]